MSKIVTLGEIMLRLSTENSDKLVQTDKLKINYGGGEANVAVALGNFGVDTEYITKLPENSISKAIIKYLKANNVRTDNIVYGGERIGLYYLETGYGMRATNVIYDRKNSSFSTIKYEELNIDSIFEDCKIIHLSGITAALSSHCSELIEKIMRKAKTLGILVSFDFNYRSKLWEIEEAKQTIEKYLPYIDICFAGKLDCKNILRLGESDDIVYYYQQIIQKYPNIKYILSTDRESYSNDENSLQGYLYFENILYSSDKYRFMMKDRVGGGDAFVAGALYGIYNKLSVERIIKIAMGSSLYKHTLNGDANISDIDEIYEFIDGNNNSIKR